MKAQLADFAFQVFTGLLVFLAVYMTYKFFQWQYAGRIYP